MALRWTAAAMDEAKNGFCRLKAYKQLPALRPRLPLTTKRKQTIALLSKLRRPLNVIHGNDRFPKFKARGNSRTIPVTGNPFNINRAVLPRYWA